VQVSRHHQMAYVFMDRCYLPDSPVNNCDLAGTHT